MVLAPAMNVNMWQHPATQANLETLRRRGHAIVEPGSGFLACGMTGPGRLAEPEEIAAAVEREARQRRDLEGETVLITAGPTQEPLDPVRYLSNRSSGKMGYALAEAAAAARRARGADFRAGEPGAAARRGSDAVRTAAEMREQVLAHLPQAGIVIKAAAVADFHLTKVPDQKIKKTAARIRWNSTPRPIFWPKWGARRATGC